MAVIDGIIFNQNILIKHLGARKTTSYLFVAHEDGLGPVPLLADIQQVVPDDDVSARTVGSGGPELDHVAVILGADRPLEIVEIVALDQHPLHVDKVHTVGPDAIDIVVDHIDVRAIQKRKPGLEGIHFVTFERDGGGIPDVEPVRGAYSIIDDGHTCGDVAVKRGVKDRDAGARVNPEGL